MVAAGFFPGLGVAVTRGDRVVYVGSYGVADERTGRPVDADTAFYIASSTKALTATAVVLEAAKGALRLDAPPSRYLPGVHLAPPLRADRVTVADLLSMTDGIGECFPVVFRTAYTGVFTPGQLRDLLADCPPSKAGRAFVYRNLPYNLLGMILAPGSRDGWKDVVRRDVLQPLGMSATTARLSTLRVDRVAMPHELVPGRGFVRIPLAKGDANLHAAGGHFATARDLARFVAAHASDGLLDGRRVFPAAAIASTHTRHARQDRDFGPYHRSGWGYGWDLGTFDGRMLVHRFGSFAGYRSHMSFMPGTGIGVVVLANGVGLPNAVDALADCIYQRMTGSAAGADSECARTIAHLKAQRSRFEKALAHARARRAARQVALPHPLRAYAGVYANPQLGTLNWRVSGGTLEVSAGMAHSHAEVYDASKDQWRVQLTGGGEVVTFRFDDDAATATGFDYDGYRFRRVAAPPGSRPGH